MNGDPQESPSSEPRQPEPPGPKPGAWKVLFIVLLAPAVLSLTTAKAKSDFVFAAILLGSPIAGLICAAIIPLSPQRSPLGRLAFRFVLAVAFTIASLALSFAGCVVAAQS